MVRTGVERLRLALYWSQAQPDPTRRARLQRHRAHRRRRGAPADPRAPDDRDRAGLGAKHPGREWSPPADPAAYGRFAGQVAARFGSRGTFWAEHPELPRVPVRDYQIWNEPAGFAPGIGSVFWDDPGVPYAPGYVALLACRPAADPGRRPRGEDRPRRAVREVVADAAGADRRGRRRALRPVRAERLHREAARPHRGGAPHAPGDDPRRRPAQAGAVHRAELDRRAREAGAGPGEPRLRPDARGAGRAAGRGRHQARRRAAQARDRRRVLVHVALAPREPRLPVRLLGAAPARAGRPGRSRMPAAGAPTGASRAARLESGRARSARSATAESPSSSAYSRR